MKDFDNGWISRYTVPLKNSLKYRFTGGIKPHTKNKKVLTGIIPARRYERYRFFSPSRWKVFSFNGNVCKYNLAKISLAK